MALLRYCRQSFSASLAMMMGLCLAVVCLANDPWPDNEGLHTDKQGPCNLFSNYCFTKFTCTNKNPGDDPALWTCADNVSYQSLVYAQVRQWGTCYDTMGACTYYDKYYCAQYIIYQFANCLTEKCRWWVYSGGKCGPP